MAREKVKKPFYKKWWVWLIAIIFLFILIPVEDDEEEKSDTSQETSAQANENKPKEDKGIKKEEKTEFKLGDKVNVGSMVYTINSIETADKVGSEYLAEEARGVFVIVDVTLKNEGNDAVTVDSTFFELKRGEKTYEAEGLASMYANEDSKTSFFLEKLNPDLELSGKVVFDVSDEVAQASDLKIQVQTGFWGTEKELINLR